MAYITKGIGGFYYVKTPDGVVECKARGIFRKRGITPVAGDNVTLSDDGTMIDEILPRKNVFIRPPIANLDILFIVTSTTQPVPSTLVLDQLAAAAIYKDVQPVLVVTKSDLVAADMLRTAYAGSGIPLVQLNYETGEGLDEVKGYIEGHLCAFCGNSGVGKSTLLNTLAPALHRVPGPYFGQCRFTGCSHRSETGCAVREAVEAGTISKTRYASYLAMYEEASARKEWEK